MTRRNTDVRAIAARMFRIVALAATLTVLGAVAFHLPLAGGADETPVPTTSELVAAGLPPLECPAGDPIVRSHVLSEITSATTAASAVGAAEEFVNGELTAVPADQLEPSDESGTSVSATSAETFLYEPGEALKAAIIVEPAGSAWIGSTFYSCFSLVQQSATLSEEG